MAAISRDFVITNGIIIQGNNAVTSSTNQSNAFQLAGGAAVAKNLIVGTTATIFGNAELFGSLSIGGPILPTGNGITLGSPSNPFADLYLSGNSLYIGRVVTSTTGTTITFSSTSGSTLINAGSLSLSATTNSTSTITGSLITAGGAGIARNLNVGGDAKIRQDLSVTGTAVVGSTLAVGGVASFNSADYATTGGQGSVKVAGGVRINDNLVVMSANANTGTLEVNAVYVEGGVGVKGGIAVSGVSVFKNDVFFQGQTTHVYSTNTVYTDNLIEIHAAPAGLGGTWSGNDGKDIGLQFHYYNTVDKNAALVLSNNSKKLEFFIDGNESGGNFVGTYGAFKTGSIQLVDTTSNGGTTATGALTVAGDVGIGRNVFVGGIVTATNLAFTSTLNSFGVVYQDSTGKLVSQPHVFYNTATQALVGTITRANNLVGGVAGAIPIQNAIGNTVFITPSAFDNQVLTWINGTAAWAASSLTAVEYSNTATNIAGGDTGFLLYQLSVGRTSFVTGPTNGYLLTYNGSSFTPEWRNPSAFTVGYATTATTSTYANIANTATYANIANTATYANIANTATYAGTTNTATFAFTATFANISNTATYANIANTSTYANIANTSTYAFTSTFANIANTSTYANISNTATFAFTSTYANIANTSTYAFTSTFADIAFTSTYANIANTATFAFTSTYANIANTSTYADIANTSTYANIANTSTYANIANTATYANIANTSTYANIANTSTYAFTSTYANSSTNIIGGRAGSIPYQSSTGTTTFLDISTSNYILLSNGSVPTWRDISGLSAGTSAIAENVKNGTAGQLVYQITTSTSGFAGPGTVGQLLMSSGTTAPVYVNTSSIRVGSTELATNATYASTATNAINLVGGETGSIPYQSTGSSTTFIAGGAEGALLRYFNNSPVWITTASLSGGTASSSTVANQSLTVTNGGIGVSGDSYFDNNLVVDNSIYSNGSEVITTATVDLYATKTTILAGTDTAVNTSTGIVTVWNTSTLQSITNRGSTTNNIVTITNVTSATSTITGALQVFGGIGVGGNVYSDTINVKRYVDFNLITEGNEPTYREGRLYYHSDEKTLILQGNSADVDIAVGQREWVRCRNSSGAPIPKGSPVYVTGVHIPGNPIHGHHPTIALADASDVVKKDVIGLAGETIAAGAHGYVIVRGYIENVDTSALTSAGRIHLGFAQPGTLVSIAPEYPNYPMDVGLCLTQDATSGTIYVNIFDHSFERIRVEGSGYVDGDFTVGGNLTIIGNANKTLVSNLQVTDNWVYLGAGDTIVTHYTTGTGGLNDMTFKGHFQGSTQTVYSVKIDSTGTNDTFAWSTNSFVTTSGSLISITENVEQVLENGIGIMFETKAGHKINDLWTGTAVLKNLDFGIIGNYHNAATSVYTHAGVFRDATDGEFKFFTSYRPEISGNIDVNTSSFALGNLTVNRATSSLVAVTSTLTSTSEITGALTVAGGAGIVRDLWVGGNIYSNGSQVLTSSGGLGYVSSILAGTDTAISTATGSVTIWNTSTLQSITNRGAVTSNAVSITNTTSSINTTTGALQVAGGVGIVGSLQGSSASFTGVVTATTFVGNLTGIATTATNLAGGNGGGLPYQSSTGTTTFLTIGTNGFVLTSNGSSPTWAAVSGLSAGNATTATNIAGGTAGQVPYQVGAGSTSFYGPGTAGNVLVSNGTSAPAYQNTLTLASTATSISTSTGALQVRGGVGVADSVYVGNRVGFVSSTGTSAVYQFYNTATNSLDTVFA
jgi:hypothetical protein